MTRFGALEPNGRLIVDLAPELGHVIGEQPSVPVKDQLYRENLAVRDEVDRALMFEEIVGSSKTLKTALSRIAKVAPTDSTALITGETGTGKELIASRR